VKWLGLNGMANLAMHQAILINLCMGVQLIEQGDAYVDLQSPEEIKLNRGNFVEPGKNSPYRDTSVEENLARFEKMRNGEFKEGEAVLRAKIDMEPKCAYA
jgi:glutaminyl-tRNA synthetase